MQMVDYFQCPRELWLWGVNEIIWDRKQLQATTQLFHHPLQPRDKIHIKNQMRKNKWKKPVGYKLNKKYSCSNCGIICAMRLCPKQFLFRITAWFDSNHRNQTTAFNLKLPKVIKTKTEKHIKKEFQLTINLNLSIVDIASGSPWTFKFSKLA